MERITVQGKRLIDEQGRERMFRGLNLKSDSNIVRENPPLGQLEMLDEEFFRRSAAMGFRLLRLGVCWEDLEPEKGKYNETYLKAMDGIFDLAQTYGVYVFLDMHQDLWSSFGKSAGDGAPAWACLSDGHAPRPAKVVWAEGYFFGKAVQRCFDHFWANDPVQGKGLQDHFCEVWRMLARRYGGHPAFFGFDFFNEPFLGTPGGKVFRTLVAKLVRVCGISPSVHRIEFLKTVLNKQTRGKMLDVLTPAVLRKVTAAGEPLVRKFDLEQYTPFLEKVTKAVREVTQNGVLVMEHSYYSNIGVPFSAKAPAGEAVVYSPHGYDFTVDTPAYAHANNARVGAMFEENLRAQKRLDTPVIVGEWGGGGEGESFFPHIEYLLDLFDSFLWSNTYFAYTRGFLDQPIMRLLTRPYPMAVNGKTEKFKTDPKAKTFTLWYTPNATDAWTEIHLPNGYDSLAAGEGAQALLEGDVLKIKETSGKIQVNYR